MARKTGVGIQNFGEIIAKDNFYVDKTAFIKEWWESGDEVTLIARPRRFGKTLTMSMVEHFFSLTYKEEGELFHGLAVWQDPDMRKWQGTYLVISLSFANVKEISYENTRQKLCQILANLYTQNRFLRDSDVLGPKDREYFDRIASDMNDSDATMALHQLSDYLSRYYGRRVIILLDEYDTPMQEAYVYGYWEQLEAFTRSLTSHTHPAPPPPPPA